MLYLNSVSLNIDQQVRNVNEFGLELVFEELDLNLSLFAISAAFTDICT